MKNKAIRLFWWNEKVFHNRQQENYGDLMGKYLVQKLSGTRVRFAKPADFSLLDLFSPIYVTIGSILAHVNRKCIVWGSGIISRESRVKKAEFLAVRGPLTRKRLLDLGYQVPEVYGDPALLLPRYFKPEVKKKYKIGIIPHYTDYPIVKECMIEDTSIHVINLRTDDIEFTTSEILACERILSSSLHGLIVPHTYGIPAVWLKISDNLFGDDVKFEDYFASVNMDYYISRVNLEGLTYEKMSDLFSMYPALPLTDRINKLQEDLLACCPFKSK
jgi:pyruvyltransferase